MRKLPRLIQELIDRAWNFRFFYDKAVNERYRPGEFITKLPAEERAQLKKATAKDFDHRVDAATMYSNPGTSRRGRLGKAIDEQREQERRKVQKTV